MKMEELATELISSTDKKYYVYLSKEPKNLDRVSAYVVSNVDFNNKTTVFYICFPHALSKIGAPLDGVFADNDHITKGQILLHCKLSPGAKITWVDGSTGEIL